MGLALGGAVGVGMTMKRRQASIEEHDEPMGLAVARTAAGTAAAGAAVGLLLDRRSRRKVLTRRQKLAAAKGVGSVLALADAARPVVRSAAEHARPVVKSAADAARPRVEHAGDVARARAQQAAKSAKAKLAEVDLPVLVAV